MTVTAPIVSMEGVTFSYAKAEKPTLDDVNLTVAEGEFVAIEGPTGAGKTTMVLVLNGIIPHATAGRFKGNVTIAGTNTKSADVADLARLVGVVYQDPESQLFGLTVEEDVAFGLENLGIPRDEMHERVDWALGAVELSDVRLKSPSRLSGGQKQRLAIASVLAMRPRVMILDEPTAELDPLGKQSILEVVRRLSRDLGLTVVLVEHECDFVAEYADRVVLVQDGKLVRSAPPRSFYTWACTQALASLRVPQVARLKTQLDADGVTSPLDPLPLGVDEAAGQIAVLLDGTSPVAPAPYAGPGASTPGEPIVTAEALHHRYTDGTHALRGVELTLRRGEYVALVGQNGSGKTTLARHLNGLLRPTEGHVLVGGDDIAKRSVAELSRTVGYVFQNPDHQLFADVIAKEVGFGPLAHGLPQPDIDERVDRALRLCGIEGLRDEHPLFVSRGERQLVAIASVVAIRPDVVIFDEPTTGLDEVYCELVLDLMDHLHADGHTIVVITHDMRLVAERTERILVLKDGAVLVDGSTREVFDQAELLAETRIAPPQVTQLSHRLRPYGIRTALTVHELVRQISVRGAAALINNPVPQTRR
jgi:energy-coupling factor transport system ATP-binding protein